MSYHSSKSGFTLIEVLIGLMCLPILITLFISILHTMISIEVPKPKQIHVFKLQLEQSLNRSTNVSFESDKITYNYNNQSFIIELDGSRLVRRPGYEILLENVLDLTIKENYIKVCELDECIEV